MTDESVAKIVQAVADLVKDSHRLIERLCEKATVHPEKAASLHSRERFNEVYTDASVKKEVAQAAMPGPPNIPPEISEDGVAAETLEQATQ